jgi:hypothetical protein
VSYPFRDAGVAADSLTDIHNGMVKCLFVVNSSCIHEGFYVSPRVKNPDEKLLANARTMQWAFFHLSIGHDK